jgi:hypothetical protein
VYGFRRTIEIALTYNDLTTLNIDRVRMRNHTQQGTVAVASETLVRLMINRRHPHNSHTLLGETVLEL